jgi:transposase
MARKQIVMNEIVEIIYQWHQGSGIKAIKRSLGFDRKTVRKYVHMGQEVGVQRGVPFPSEDELIRKLKELSNSSLLRETPAQDLIVPHRDWIAELIKDEQMTAKQVWRLFEEKTDLSIGYCTVNRYLKTEFQFGVRPVTVRLEVEPGSQAQVDFGYVGMMVDPFSGKSHRAWAFIMTMSFSRHRFVRFVFRQDVKNWIDCHIRAFEFFGGAPATIVLDNLKAAVIKPDIYDPTLNRAYAELERHYGFVADPAKVRMARHKGKVERSVPVVRKHLLAGRKFEDINQANGHAIYWCRDEIGMEIHGTTKRRPYEVFKTEEAHCLKPLPTEPFERPLWKECTVHQDHHVVFDNSYYSVPTRFIGTKVWVRGGRKMVNIFLDGQLIKSHPLADRPGTFRTDPLDYPPEKLAYLMRNPSYCCQKASEVGPLTGELVKQVLCVHTAQNLRKAQAILRLAEKFGPASMEVAAGRCLAFGNLRLQSIKTVLEKGWTIPKEKKKATVSLSAQGQGFLRSPEYFAANKEVCS